MLVYVQLFKYFLLFRHLPFSQSLFVPFKLVWITECRKQKSYRGNNIIKYHQNFNFCFEGKLFRYILAFYCFNSYLLFFSCFNWTLLFFSYCIVFELEKVTKACKKDRDFIKMEKGDKIKKQKWKTLIILMQTIILLDIV